MHFIVVAGVVEEGSDLIYPDICFSQAVLAGKVLAGFERKKGAFGRVSRFSFSEV